MDKDTFLALAAHHYDKPQAVGKEPDFFTREASFDKILTDFSRVVLEKQEEKYPLIIEKNFMRTRY